MQKLFQKFHNRVLPFFLAVLMLASTFPLNVLSIGAGAATEGTANGTPSPDGYIYDYDTLKITKDGKETYAMDLLSYEKITISADGVEEKATYQWQILHNEKENVWIDIYDATEKDLPVTLALLGNLLRDDNTAKLRCRAYTEDYAYLTSPITVTVKEPAETKITLPTQNVENPSFKAGVDEIEFVTVTIQYVRFDFLRDEQGDMVKEGDSYKLNDGTEAFSSYIATLVRGNELDTTVTFPTLVGYEAFWEGETTPTLQKKFDKQQINESLVFTVSYKPDLVDYSVRYFFQNIYDDKYTENPSLLEEYSSKGYTGSTPEDNVLRPSVPGFTALYYHPDSLAADGSTAFEVYYERNYYLMEFDCNGGYGTETLYVRYGSYIAVPDPVRTGYTFEFWDLARVEDSDGTVVNKKDGVETIDDKLPSTMPAHNSAYIAVWGVAETTYTIAYWTQDNGEYTFLGSRSQGADSGDKVSGSDDLKNYAAVMGVDHFEQMNYVSADVNRVVEGDGSTIVNVYYEYKTYTLKFYYAISKGNTYYVVGGSTYYFGSLGGATSDDTTLLAKYVPKVSNANEIGEVNKPTLNSRGQDRLDRGIYTSGSETVNGYAYHYISFDARYGSNIRELWPCDVFNPTTVKFTPSGKNNNWTGTTAFVSAWNGEYYVKYTRDSSVNNGNETIKGKYEVLDDNLLFWNYTENYQPAYANGNGKNAGTVSYMCFWENGSNKDWSIPELYRYNIYLQVYEGMDTTGKTVVRRDGVDYYLNETYDTCDDSNVSSQTQPSLTGYKQHVVANQNNAYRYDNQTYPYLYSGKFEYRALRTGEYDSAQYAEAYELNFYYDANTNSLSFYNYNAPMTAKGGEVDYNTPLSLYRISDSDMQTLYYPQGVEPGSLEFAGWYTSAGCYDGTEVDWSADTMPDNDVTLYAKWTPIVRTVTFYSAYSDIKKDEDDLSDTIYHFMYADNVPHGTNLGSAYLHIPDHPADKTLEHTQEGDADYNESLKYDFVGWFYMDENNKKRFAPDSMEVTGDLVLFAEWQTAIDTTYEIKYVLKNATSNTPSHTEYPAGTEIAEKIEAHASVGQTKTFEAKAGSALLPDFGKYFFPTSNSHSILMEADPGKNTYSFEYIFDDKVHYKIRYLEQGTNKELATPYIGNTLETGESIITVKFKPIKDHLPTSYYITRSLQYDGNATEPIEENIFTFYYVNDTVNGLYSVEYYWENVDSEDASKPENYTMYESTVGKAKIGTKISADDRSYDKFGLVKVPGMNTVITYKENGEKDKELIGSASTGDPPGGTVSNAGLTIKVYYRRKAMNYTIQYVAYGGSLLHQVTVPADTTTDPNNWTPKVDSNVIVSAPDTYPVGGVTYYFYPTSDRPQTQTHKIRKDAENNVITFYYKLKDYTIQYIPKCTVEGLTDFGVASPNMDYVSRTTDIGGSTATPSLGFRFVNWRDQNGNVVCTDPYWKPTSFVGADATDHIYYYAYFEPVYSTLSITKALGTTTQDTFLFHIKGQGKVSYIDIVVSIQGPGTIVLEKVPVGTYTVTELTGWSWEYTCSAVTATGLTITGLTNGAQFTLGETGGTVTFTNTPKPSNWLSDETVNENQFKVTPTP